jgi:hypothetical protein
VQDPNPTPWGTQDRYQAHYIVRVKNIENVLDYTARSKLFTTGHFGSKKITDVNWNGGKISKVLDSDTSLKELILQQSPNDAIISIEPTNEGVRIYGKWKNGFELGISKDLFEIYDKIAGHIKNI